MHSRGKNKGGKGLHLEAIFLIQIPTHINCVSLEKSLTSISLISNL